MSSNCLVSYFIITALSILLPKNNLIQNHPWFDS